VHTHPYYRRELGFGWGEFPVSEGYYAKALSLPLYPGMSDLDADHVIDAVLGIVKE